MLDGLVIGSFTVNTQMLGALIAVVASALYLKLRFRRDDRMKSFFDVAINAGFVLLLTWKFGAVLFEPWRLWEDPLYLLLLTGGRAETVVGILFAVVYAWPRLIARGVGSMYALDAVALALPVGLAVYHAMMPRYGKLTDMPWGITLLDPQYQYHPLHYYWLAACLISTLILWREGGTPGEGRSLEWMFLTIGAAGMIVSWFEVAEPLGLGLTSEQLLYSWLLIIGYVIRQLRIIKAERS